jgi:hypothetical protein
VKHLALAVSALALCACATSPPGEDPHGRQMRAQATPVLVALAAYRKDKGSHPSSLYELTPRYVKELPMHPNLDYDRGSGQIGFVYERGGVRFRQVGCKAEPGQVEWTCHLLE